MSWMSPVPDESGVIQDAIAEQEVNCPCPQIMKKGHFCMFSLFKHKMLLIYLPKLY